MATPESLLLFIAQLDGWMNSDGDKDRCPVCWEKLLASFDDPRHLESIRHFKNEYRVAKYARSRRSPEGWFVFCEGFRDEACPNNAEVFVPYGTRRE